MLVLVLLYVVTLFETIKFFKGCVLVFESSMTFFQRIWHSKIFVLQIRILHFKKVLNHLFSCHFYWRHVANWAPSSEVHKIWRVIFQSTLPGFLPTLEWLKWGMKMEKEKETNSRCLDLVPLTLELIHSSFNFNYSFIHLSFIFILFQLNWAATVAQECPSTSNFCYPLGLWTVGDFNIYLMFYCLGYF